MKGEEEEEERKQERESKRVKWRRMKGYLMTPFLL